MFVPRARPEFPLRRQRAALRAGAFTLVEIMISLGVLAVATMGSISAFMILNRYAANLRNTSVARALCQERIEQALTLGFAPTNSAVPRAPNSDPSTISSSPTLNILGAITSYNTATGAYNGSTNMQTSTESIPIALQSDGTALSTTSANIVYTRTTTTSAAGLNYATSSSATTATSLNVVQFTVTVSWVFHGQTYSTSMTTMRSPD